MNLNDKPNMPALASKLPPDMLFTLAVGMLADHVNDEEALMERVSWLMKNAAFRLAVKGLTVQEANELRDQIKEVNPSLAPLVVDFFRLEEAFDYLKDSQISIGIEWIVTFEGVLRTCDKRPRKPGTTLHVGPEHVIGLHAKEPIAVTEKAGPFLMPVPENYRDIVFKNGVTPCHLYLAAALADDYAYPLAHWVQAFRDDVNSLAARVCQFAAG